MAANTTETRLDALSSDRANARLHGERNLELITDALKEVGAARSIVVDETGTVLAGNATIAAAGRTGLSRVRIIDADGTELIAVRRSGLTPDQKRRLALYDNRAAELAEWDTDMLASLADEIDLSALWDTDELKDLLGTDDAPVALQGDADTVPDVPDDPVTQPGDLWRLGSHRLLCGDATIPADVRCLMDGQRSPLMPTDPPYLVNYQGGNHPQSWSNRQEVKDKHWDDYREADGATFFARFLRVALDEALTSNPAVYQFHASSRQVLVEQAWRECGLLLHQQLIWMKARSVLTHSHYMWQHEPCFYGWIQGNPPTRKPPANATTIWQVDQVGESQGLHPTRKPVEVIRRMVAYHTGKDEVVYEPFGGSGTALIACELLGRRCNAMEQAPAFCDVIVQRWEARTGGTAERTPDAVAG